MLPPVVLLHGDLGGWDELALAVVGFLVLWVTVKLAGRKPKSDGEGSADVEPVEDDAPRQAHQP